MSAVDWFVYSLNQSKKQENSFVQALIQNRFAERLATGPHWEYDPMASTGQLPPSNPAQGARSRESPLISVKMFSSSAITQILIDFLIYCGRALLIFYPVYLTGYLGLSISWVLLCMFVLTYWKKNRQWKDARIGSAIELADSEIQVVNTELKSALQMASWVCNELICVQNETVDGHLYWGDLCILLFFRAFQQPRTKCI